MDLDEWISNTSMSTFYQFFFESIAWIEMWRYWTGHHCLPYSMMTTKMIEKMHERRKEIPFVRWYLSRKPKWFHKKKCCYYVYYYFFTPVPSLISIKYLIPRIPKTDLGSPQIVESDGTLEIAKTSNVPHFYIYFINQKFLV